MLESTKQRYLKLAANFYRTRMNGAALSTSNIRSALTNAAPSYRPDYFRVLKNALAFDVRERGYSAAAEKILKIQNPTTQPESTLPVKAKRPSAKALSEDDFSTLCCHLGESGKADVFAAVILAWHLGVRPSEMQKIRVEGEQFYITGAKKDDTGIRGADRILMLPNPDDSSLAADAVDLYKTTRRSLGATRDTLREQCRLLWPRRKVQPTLKSLRHQLGSNLKASGLAPETMAYIMGHQSTRSIERYGDRRLAHKGSRSLPSPAPDADTSKVRVRSGSKPAWHSALTATKSGPLPPPIQQIKRHST